MSIQMPKNTMIPSGPRTTPFGATVNPGILSEKKGAIVLQVDTLCALKDMFGENILTSRRHLYNLVSGDCTDAEFKQLLNAYYRRFHSFSNYLDEVYIFGDSYTSFTRRLIGPIRDVIQKYEDEIIYSCNKHNGVYLGNSKDYAYFEFKSKRAIPTIEGSKLC